MPSGSTATTYLYRAGLVSGGQVPTVATFLHRVYTSFGVNSFANGPSDNECRQIAIARKRADSRVGFEVNASHPALQQNAYKRPPFMKQPWGSSRVLLLAAIVFVIVAGPLAYLLAVLRQGHVVAGINSVGGSVTYEREYDYREKWESVVCETGESVPFEPPAPGVMERVLGPDTTSVSCIDLRRHVSSSDDAVGRPINDDFMRNVSALRSVRTLDVTFQPITDAGLKLIEALPRLEILRLYGTQVTDESIRTLSTLPMLSTLHIGCTRITKRGISELAMLPQLRSLILSRDQLDDLGGRDAIYAIFASGVVGIGVEEITPAGDYSYSRLSPPTLLQSAEPGDAEGSR